MVVRLCGSAGRLPAVTLFLIKLSDSSLRAAQTGRRRTEQRKPSLRDIVHMMRFHCGAGPISDNRMARKINHALLFGTRDVALAFRNAGMETRATPWAGRLSWLFLMLSFFLIGAIAGPVAGRTIEVTRGVIKPNTFTTLRVLNARVSSSTLGCSTNGDDVHIA